MYCCVTCHHAQIEESLVKVKLYTQATQVQSAAEELYQAELEQTHQAYEAELRLKMVKFQAKQQQEAEALLQRGARGRDELELRRVNETERRTYRFRNIVAVSIPHIFRNLHLQMADCAGRQTIPEGSGTQG
jgi:hypothetical protein